MLKRNISAHEKISAVQRYLDGLASQRMIAHEFGIAQTSVQQWIVNYESMGEDAFLMRNYKSYSAQLKVNAVKDYLSGEGSQTDICKKYGIRSKSKLQKWIKKYNGHEELKSFGTGETPIMTKGRNTTFDERVEIVQYGITHEHNYAELKNIRYLINKPETMWLNTKPMASMVFRINVADVNQKLK